MAGNKLADRVQSGSSSNGGSGKNNKKNAKPQKMDIPRF